MNQVKDQKGTHARREKEGVTRLSIAGFKSISQEQSIEIRPLTILAGANSSGKSSMMQPLLLLKQTLEESYDPGALLLYGPNVKFTSVGQLLSRVGKSSGADVFSIRTEVGTDVTVELRFSSYPDKSFNIQEVKVSDGRSPSTLRLGMTHEELMDVIPSTLQMFYEGVT